LCHVHVMTMNGSVFVLILPFDKLLKIRSWMIEGIVCCLAYKGKGERAHDSVFCPVRWVTRAQSRRKNRTRSTNGHVE
jgi:hypothetical protein